MQEEPTNPNLEEEEVQPSQQPQPSEPAPSEPAPSQPEELQEPKPSQPEQEPQQPSRREQLRVQQLLDRYGPPGPQRQQAPSQQKKPDFRSRITADDQVYEDLEKLAEEYGEGQYQAGQSSAAQEVQYSTWRRFLLMDENNIRSKYPELNPSNGDKYHKAVEQALQKDYLTFVGYNPGDPQKGISPTVANPDVSYAEYVEARMEFADEIASMKLQGTTQNIAQQAATTGLRPDGSAPKRMDLAKDPTQMSDEELKAAIGATLPRDARGRFTSSK